VSELCPSTYCTLSLSVLATDIHLFATSFCFFRAGKIFPRKLAMNLERIRSLFVRLSADLTESTVGLSHGLRKLSCKVLGTLFSRQILVRIPNTKFHENTYIGNRVVPNGRTDSQTNLPFSVSRQVDFFHRV
jgi:hypothetical protein